MLLRRAQVGDEAGVASVHVRSWQVAYRGLIDQGYLDGLRPEDRARSYTFDGTAELAPVTVLAVEAGVIRGFVTTGASREEDLAPSGEVCAIYVDPGSWGLGIGKALMASARATLRHQGHTDASLWVLVGNARADRFYRSDGWLPDGSRRRVPVHGIEVDEVRYHTPLR
ncbi:MAG: GNAT family N-acetyltransferase [Acidimicrobiales bacterium]